uniref:Uncharacterized protein n=1 Tax=Eutreptiella gymnastica TaxID=73025 RepID=A0A7S4FSI9_9EUGL|mmetsp:Transcript_348/g.603  ORF Transcript_348/g.603 Transcript_348/m.603 type:complete len:114 (-) Transcript_348:93-434(-)
MLRTIPVALLLLKGQSPPRKGCKLKPHRHSKNMSAEGKMPMQFRHPHNPTLRPNVKQCRVVCQVLSACGKLQGKDTFPNRTCKRCENAEQRQQHRQCTQTDDTFPRSRSTASH